MRRLALGLVLGPLLVGCGRGPYLDILVTRRGCEAVDFAFVIDNSESMAPHQENLRRNFGPFVEGIQETLDEVDSYHVGVVTTDDYATNPESCRQIGSLVRRNQTVFPDSCGPFAEGHAYMTEADDLEAGFNCIADVGVSGGRNEAPMKALTNVIGSGRGEALSLGWYDRCVGEDFIRDNALLVAVVVTDEEDGEGDNEAGPDIWYDDMVAAKGREDNAVVISLVNGGGTRCETDNPAFDGQNIADFTHRFTHGYVDGICERDYGAIFDVATEAVEEACEEYVTILHNVGS